MVYRHKSYADKLFIRINRAILCRQEPCPHSDDSSRDELIFRGSYADNYSGYLFWKTGRSVTVAAPVPRDCGKP